MTQAEIPYSPPKMKRVRCTKIKTVKRKGVEKKVECGESLTVYPGVDPNFLLGECHKCGHLNVVKNEK